MPLPRRLALFNRRVTNHVARLAAGHLPGMGIVVHRGRTTGRTYRTPVNVFRTDEGYVIPLTYGETDWVRNVRHGAGARLETRGRTHTVSDPRVVDAPDHPALPKAVGAILRRLDAPAEMHVRAVDDRADDG